MQIAMNKILGLDTPVFIILLCVAVPCAIGAGKIAEGKGYSYAAFAAIGFFLPVVGLIVAAVLPDKKGGNAETLLNYKKLLDEGVITQAEFDEKKKELLG